MWDGYESLEARGKTVVNWNVPPKISVSESLIPYSYAWEILPSMEKTKPKKDFEDVIQLRILRWGDNHGLCRWGLNAMKSILIREKKTDTQTGRQCEDGAQRCSHKQSNATGDMKLVETRNRFSPRAAGGSIAVPTLQFQTFSLQNCNRINFSCLKPLVCGNLLQQPHRRPTWQGSWSVWSGHLTKSKWMRVRESFQTS